MYVCRWKKRWVFGCDDVSDVIVDLPVEVVLEAEVDVEAHRIDPGCLSQVESIRKQLFSLNHPSMLSVLSGRGSFPGFKMTIRS